MIVSLETFKNTNPMSLPKFKGGKDTSLSEHLERTPSMECQISEHPTSYRHLLQYNSLRMSENHTYPKSKLLLRLLLERCHNVSIVLKQTPMILSTYILHINHVWKMWIMRNLYYLDTLGRTQHTEAYLGQ
jgi:hypothetical protein